MSILLNGFPTSEFSMSNGVRQGDPLSPLLFNLEVEVLSEMIGRASRSGLLKVIQLGGFSEQINHLHYADDTIIFLSDEVDSVIAIKRILQSFQLLSGLKINFNKSSLFSCSKDEEKIKKYVQILGCKKGS